MYRKFCEIKSFLINELDRIVCELWDIIAGGIMCKKVENYHNSATFC